MTDQPPASAAVVELKIVEIEFASGAKVKLNRDSILVLVGPNNAGKSLTLRETFRRLIETRFETKAVKSVLIKKRGGGKALDRHFEDWGFETDNMARWFGGYSLRPTVAIHNEWNSEATDYLGHSATLFALLINADTRIQATKPADRIPLEREVARVPIHRLEKKIDAEIEVSTAFHSVFDQEIALNRNAGSEVPIHVGRRPRADALGGELSVKYSEAVSKLPLITDQGDGMIAFLGLLLYVVGVPRDIYFVDEPDIYLHPPQAYTAGHLLAEKTAGRQLVVATHNAHLLRGLLDRAKDRLRIVRLDRTTGIQSVKVIDPNLFEETRNDPILKFAPVLEALFYNWVIVCEDESDCLFYRAILEENGYITEASPIFWISAHGKQNLRKVAGLLRSLGIQVISIADFDILNDDNVLRPLIEAHDGKWEDFSEPYATIKKSIEQRKPTMATDDVTKEISNVLAGIDARATPLFPKAAEDVIREIFKKASPWRELKGSGIYALDAGEATVAAKQLLKSLESIGIFVPLVGETESFCKAIGGHGVVWVDGALNRNLRDDPEFEQARRFAAELANKIGDQGSVSPEAAEGATAT